MQSANASRVAQVDNRFRGLPTGGWWVAALLAALLGAPLPRGAAAERTTGSIDPVAADVIGRKVDEFELEDYRGRAWKLAEFADKKLVVLVFLGVECPLAKLYAVRLNELAAEFAPRGVAIVGIDSNRQDSLTEMAAFARTHEIGYPLLKDTGNRLADLVGAQRTPEAFVLDAERAVRYAGRIDDQYGFERGSSYQRAKATTRDLAVALESLLAGNAPTPDRVPAPGCLIGRARAAAADAEVTYSNQISRLLNTHCVQCHREGQIGPFPLTSYDEAAGWADMIAEVVSENRMPPWHADPRYGHFANDARLSDAEKQQIAAWAAAGAPEGDASQLPEPPKFAQGWLMGQAPDLVIPVRETAYEVPAEGEVAYQYFTVDPGFTEDKWVTIAECMPGNHSVVHHIIAFVKPPQGKGPDDARGFEFLVGFAPGTRPFECLPGMAKFIPAGSKLVFQMHYTPNGKAAQDISSLGLVFAKDPASIRYRVVTDRAINTFFEIPAGADNYEVRAMRKIRKPTTLLSLFPHMHVRGKSFHYELFYPDGSREVLLDVPRYDFNWQNHFILSEPKVLPAGSRIKCVAHYDNSEENLSNPDPKSPVRWGDQTWEEMMIGWYDVAVAVGETPDHDRSDDNAADDDESQGGGD